MATHPTLPRLKDLGLFFRLGITCLVVTLLGSAARSGSLRSSGCPSSSATRSGDGDEMP